MIHFLVETLKQIMVFYNEIAIYLLFGFFIAGILHVFFPESIIRRHFGKNSIGSVVKLTLFGIPLPLCSCGVIPLAASLKKNGASKGACVSFLISTPEVGADSFMITYSLFGWIFAVFRVIASIITAIVAGIVVNFLSAFEKKPTNNNIDKAITLNESTKKNRFFSIFGYIQNELLGSIANALVIGLIIAGVIYALIPADFFEKYLNYPFLSLFVMLLIGIPMYVCASASTPIAASLVMKGISPGAALVFLLTGPATNAITISTVIKILGKKIAVAYLVTLSVISLGLGYLLNVFTQIYGFNNIIFFHHIELLPPWLTYAASIALALMLIWHYIKNKILNKKKLSENTGDKNTKQSIFISSMTCNHCASKVKKAIESVSGTANIFIDLSQKKVEFNISDNKNIEKVKTAIKAAGFN